jgi:adenylate kinase family enzyme
MRTKWLSVVGLPLSGRTTLCSGLVRHGVAALSEPAFRAALESSSSSAAVDARGLVSAGKLITSVLKASIWKEVARSSPIVALHAYPRALDELLALEDVLETHVHVVHLTASAALLEARAQRLGRLAIETARTGPFSSIAESLRPVLAHAEANGMLLELSADQAPEQLVELVAHALGLTAVGHMIAIPTNDQG